jgi:hypothetical protein
MLREQHDRTIATMNQMLAEAAGGFQQTAQDMRVTAQQVVICPTRRAPMPMPCAAW